MENRILDYKTLIMKKIICLLFVLFSVFKLTAEIKVINPVKGRWANKQILVLDTSDGADYFYSLNGEDPEISGFAYDGPVLLDVTGDITLKISRAFEEKSEVHFYVNPELPSSGSNAKDSASVDERRSFVYSFFDTGIVNYFAGNRISIPQSLRYTFETVPENFIPGKTISYSDKCTLSRSIPCTVTDGKLFWRFIINTIPKSSGNYLRKDLPFTIKNWNTIVFDDENMLFKIDAEYWELPQKSRVLDRKVSHSIYWQSLYYDAENPVEFYELPPLPELVSITNDDGSVSFVLDGDDSYSMNFKSDSYDFYDLYTELNADTFSGDYLKESSEIVVYSNSFYQGSFHVDYEVDKRLPSYPVFTPSIPGFHVRGQVSLNVKTTGNNNLYVSVSEPLILDDSNYTADSPKFKDGGTAPAFKKYGNSADIVLSAKNDKPVFYRVKAYSQSGKARSDVSEYTVLIDNYSFYFDEDGDKLLADGSKEHPFTSFEQLEPVLKDYKSVNIFVKGKMVLPEKTVVLNIGCEVTGLENAVIEVPEKASVLVKDASFSLSNCRIIKSAQSARSTRQTLINVEKGKLFVSNCDVFFQGSKNSSLIDASSSEINLKGSSATVTAQVYASCIAAVNCRINIENCKAAVVSDTTVGFSVRDSDFTCKGTSFRLTGSIGRVCELYNSKGTVTDNEFSADLKRTGSNGSAFYADTSSSITESGNYCLGF